MKTLWIWLSMLVLTGTHVLAQEEAGPENAEEDMTLDALVSFEHGPVTGRMGQRAVIAIPEGYRFTGPEGTRTMMELTGNLVSDTEIGFVMPEDFGENEDTWFLVFEFSDVGHVKDDEKDSLNADKILKQLKENEKHANAVREQRGMSTLHLQGWAVEPYYNPATHNMEWGTRILAQPENEIVVNHNIRLLGRRGYVEATLVCSPDQLDSVRKQAETLLSGFEYVQGERYAEYRQGDKIAQYGLTGLVVGGAVAAAAKTGLLQKLIKPLIIGVIAIGTFFKRIFGGGRTK